MTNLKIKIPKDCLDGDCYFLDAYDDGELGCALFYSGLILDDDHRPIRLKKCTQKPEIEIEFE